MNTLASLTASHLQKLCKTHGIRGYSGKKKDVLITMVSANPAAAIAATLPVPTSPPRTRRNAGANERNDLNKIVTAIKNKTDVGLKLCAAFSEFEPGSEVLDARIGMGGSRSAHYDLEVLIRRRTDTGTGAGTDTGTGTNTNTGAGTNTGTNANTNTNTNVSEPQWKRVEHKGSSLLSPFVDGAVPWAKSVQFHNGRPEQYPSICPKYARTWYDHWIGSGKLTLDWDLGTFTTPTFDEWYADACCVSIAKTLKIPWVVELETRVKRARNGECLRIERVPVVSRFVSEFTTENRIELMGQINEVASIALKEKEYWLGIQGSLDGEFNVRWFPQFELSPVVHIDILEEKDVTFRLTCADGKTLKAIMRFGGGAGICNLRLDLK